MNLPEEFKNRMKTLLGNEYEAFAEAFEKESERKGLRFSLSRLFDKGDFDTNKSDIFDQSEMYRNLTEEFTDGEIPWCRGGYYVKEDSHPGKSIYHEAGAFYLQEPSAMVVATLAGVKPGEKVLDLCAAPGGKSTALGDALQGEGILVSNEIHPARVKILSENIERMGIGNAMVLNETPEKISELFPEYFDCVVVDAPCSGLGVLRRRAEARWTKKEKDLRVFPALQQCILENASRYVKPGGVLVYSTCTMEEDENGKQIEIFLQNHREWKQAGFVHPRSKEVVKELQLYPQRDGVDGFYLTLLQKKK